MMCDETKADSARDSLRDARCPFGVVAAMPVLVAGLGREDAGAQLSRRPADDLAYFTDPSHLPLWQESVVRVERRNPTRVGTRVVAVRRVGGPTTQVAWTVARNAARLADLDQVSVERHSDTSTTQRYIDLAGVRLRADAEACTFGVPVPSDRAHGGAHDE